MRFALLAALLSLAPLASAQTDATAPNLPVAPATPPPKPAPKSTGPKLTKSQMTAAELQKTVDTLTQSNHDLLDLLQKQQAVLEDIQFDRRLQSRQIQSLEERLESTLLENNQMQNKINKLESQASLPSSNDKPAPASAPVAAPTPAPKPPAISASGDAVTITSEPKEPVDLPAAPSTPESFLPKPPPQDEPAGTPTWHRLFTLKGDDAKQSDLFPIRGRLWRVQWYNLDKPGKAFKNTSALFINAYPKDDTIPQKVCAKLGTGGDSTELQGPGYYYLKVEASGGSWELAVEDFQ
jgi:hypothetical protein